ncbi:MAG: hypothetical protein IKU98_07410, partial [Bacteroidaceae bacterium]|nr:hypothetical protein [Bacteroidaceae bacterium]
NRLVAFVTSQGTAWIGYDGLNDKWIVTSRGWASAGDIIHSSNYHNYALPLTGGTINGNLLFGEDSPEGNMIGNQTRLPSHLYRNVYANDGNVYDHYYNQSYIGSGNTFANLRVKSGSSIKALRFGGDGTFTWDENTVLHSGNYSNYALPLSGGTINGNLTIAGVVDINGHFLFARDNSGADWVVTDKNWQHEYQLVHTGNIINQKAGQAEALYGKTPDTVVVNPDNGLLTYNYNTGAGTTGLFPTISNANAFITINRHRGDYASQLGFSANSRLYYRCFNNEKVNDTQPWKEIAFTDSNVASADYAASATKLATARTIWGQSFDGTGDVSGKISGTNYIAFDNGNEIYADSNGYFAINGSANTRWLTIGYGNVGIGTTNPAYKLSVNGTFNASGSAALGSTLNVSGYSSLSGGIGVGGPAAFYGEMYAKSYLFMNADADGIYLAATSISWHGSDNGWTKTLMTFNSSGNVGISNALDVVGAATLGSTLNVSGRSMMADALTVGSSSDLAGTYKLYVNGSTRLGGLSVSGDTTLSGALFVSNSTIFNGETTYRSAAYFANGTTYYVDGSANAKFASVTSVGAVSGVNGAFSGTLAVSGVSTLTGQTNHNGGISATSGAFSGALSVAITSVFAGGATIGQSTAANG